MKKFQENVFKHDFTKKKEITKEFQSYGGNSKQGICAFRLHLKNGLLCIEFVSKVYRDTKFDVNLRFEYAQFVHEMQFLFDFSLFNNTFVIDLDSIKKKTGHSDIEFKVSDKMPLKVKVFVEKAVVPNEFCGLTNLGATCYINSLLQTMRYMGMFQKKLFEGKNNFYSLNLKRLFYAMSTNPTGADQDMVQQFIRGLPFVESVHEHQDVHEFSKYLFDKLELEDKKLIEETIEGKMDVVFKMDCGCEMRKEETYQDIQLEISGGFDQKVQNNNLLDAFSQFVQPDVIDEFTCEKHGKTRAEKRTFIGKKTPDYLFVLIKRFAFDWETGESVKNNDKFEFPKEFDLKKYMENSSPEKDNDDLNDYELLSNIVHIGSISQGHFYCFVKINGVYYKFNDEIVTVASEEEVLRWNYGGFNEFTGKEKCFGSYYLVYKKKELENKVFYLENVCTELTSEPEYRDIKIVDEDAFKNYHGPGVYDGNNNFKKMSLKNITVSQFDNIECVFKNRKVFQLKNKEGLVKFEEVKEVFGDAPVLVKSKKDKGVLLVIKNFIDVFECNAYPEKLTVLGMNSVKSFDEICEEEDDLTIFKEIVYADDDERSQHYVEKVTAETFKNLVDGDIIIATRSTEDMLNSYLAYLNSHKRVFLDFEGIKLPIVIKRNIGVREFENKVEEVFMCPKVQLVEGRTRMCKCHACFSSNCFECFLQEKNMVTLSFAVKIQVIYVGVMFGRINFENIDHVHPFLVPNGTTKEEVVKKCIKCLHLCMADISAKNEFDVVVVTKNSTNVVFYHRDSDVIELGGMLVLIDKVKNPLVVCKVDVNKNITGYPVILERTKTVGDLRKKYMLLAKIMKYEEGTVEKYIEMGDNEVLDLDENMHLFMEMK